MCRKKAINTPNQKGRLTRQNCSVGTSPNVQMRVVRGNHNGNPDIVVDDVFVLEDSGSPVYVSPYVTMCRGKEAARKEYHRRSPQGGADDSDKSTSPQAAASYFRNLLTRQTERFEQLREQWNIYKNEQKPPEGACEMIDVAAGQTNLLITNKFQEFKGLLESCRRGDSEKPVTCVDLHQFWDKVLSQVAKLDKRFENLERLKASGWEDILPIAKPRQPNTSSSSLLGAVIQEARKKKAAERPSSAEVLPTDSPPNNDRTGESPKSILKTDRSKSQGRKPKVVFFKEMSIGDENQENNQNSPNMFFSPPGGAKRRSGRLAQQKK